MGVLRTSVQSVVSALPVSAHSRDVLLDEMRAAQIRIKNKLLPSRRRELARVRRTPAQLVNVACGPQVLDGFLNLDTNESVAGVMPWDCRRSLPLDEGVAAGIRVEHFVEHLEPREELPAFLDAVRRALQPGGVVRIVVPDAARYLDAYCRSDGSGFRELEVPHPFPSDLPTRMDIVNHVFHQWHEHRWGYDFETLADRLRRAGFQQIHQMRYMESLDSRLAQDRDIHRPYSLYVDAVK
jgi:predicted SAM-dependent methyltransferase